ncbi:MAG: hypothetical protein R3Y05_06100 [bacterium]
MKDNKEKKVPPRISISISSFVTTILEDDIVCFGKLSHHLNQTRSSSTFFSYILDLLLKNTKDLLDLIFDEFHIDYNNINDPKMHMLLEIQHKNIIKRLHSLTNSKNTTKINISLKNASISNIENKYKKEFFYPTNSKFINSKEIIVSENEALKEINDILKKIIKSPNSYIRFYMEYYSTLNYAERELIHCYENHNKLRMICDKDNNMISLTTKLNFLDGRYDIAPYKIICNSTNTHYYLIGKLISCRNHNKNNEPNTPNLASHKFFSVRIAEIESIKEYETSEYISSEDKEIFDELITCKHIAYSSYENISISIKFPEKSLKKFHSEPYGRPKFKVENKDEDNMTIYVIECPMLQAVEYFSKFIQRYEIIKDEIGIKFDNALNERFELIQKARD